MALKCVRLTARYERRLRDNGDGDYRTCSLYNVGEVVGLPDDEADALIAAGKAVALDE